MKLIVEMDMPKNCCVDCEMSIDGFACKKSRTNGGKCPIVGVLPEKHGDLIDTSTVVGSIKRETDIHDVTLKEYLGFKFPVQTIVPIDEFLENRKTIPIIVAAEGNYFEMYGGDKYYHESIIQNAPTVDAVPVVRCMECKYMRESVDGLFKSGYFCERCHITSDMENCDDFYCADGERKDGERRDDD